jgi:hypothetical protein
MTTRVAAILAAGVLAVGAGLAFAQQQPNLQGRPAYGSIDLQAGFEPDPRTVQVQAGGPNSAEGLGRDCGGFIDFRQPDVNVNYRSGQFPLYISVQASADTTLVVNLPDGSWICNDDFEGTNPGIVLQRPQSGQYNIWVGTFERGNLQPSTLRISEIPPRQGQGQAPQPPGGRPPQQGQAGQPNIQGRPAFGALTLQSGFQPDPRNVEVRAGGPNTAEGLGRDCAGFIDFRQPDVNLTYRSGQYPLIIAARSSADVTLVVNLPDGSWLCNDDFDGTNPALVMERPQSGLYNIWVGTFERGNLQQSTLSITEIPPRRGQGK